MSVAFIHFPQWGSMFLPATKNEKYNEEYYYSMEYSEEEREMGLHVGSMKFAENSRAERGRRLVAAISETPSNTTSKLQTMTSSFNVPMNLEEESSVYADINTLDATSRKFTEHEDDLDRRLKEASLTSVNADLAKLSSMVSPTTANESNESTKGHILTKNTSRPVSFATLFKSAQSRKAVNFRTLVAPLGYNMSTIHVEYELTPLRCSSCKVFCHVLDACCKKIVLDVLKNLKTPRQAVRGVQNNVSSNGTKKQAGLTRQEASTSDSCDALNMNDKLDRKLVLVDDDGKPLKPHVDPVNADSDSEVDEVFSETASFMASMSSEVNKSSKSGSGAGNKSLYET
ncbi:hypothetical protein Tco_1065846 [Tanacetum coccineum]